LSPAAKEIGWSSIRSQWRDLGIIHNENSVYGNIAVIKRGEQFTFFTNGIPALTTPVPDVASIEDFAHFPMLFHERPESVLILSGGAGGLIHEVLKHGVSRIDYVEMDPLLLRLVRQFSTPLTQLELSDPRVRIHYTDGRFFTQGTPDRFDIIFVGLSVPQELQTNRYFSSEFFLIAKQRMNPHGILALALPGSSTYLAKELKEVNGCILDTLKTAFPFVRVVPGDVNLYLASTSTRIETVAAAEVFRRLESRQVQSRLITRSYLEDRLHERWQKWFSESMEGTPSSLLSSRKSFRPLKHSPSNRALPPYRSFRSSWRFSLSSSLLCRFNRFPTRFSRPVSPGWSSVSPSSSPSRPSMVISITRLDSS
jgi:spermidine synthase